MSFTPAKKMASEEITAYMEQPSEGIVHMYLTNNTSETIRVYYNLDGNFNVFISSDGGITDVPPYETVWVVTTTVAGTGDWSTGNLNYKWDPNE